MARKYTRPNISFRVDPEFQKQIDEKSEELGITRSELLKNMAYNLMHYESGDAAAYKTLTVGKLQEILEPLPRELPLIAYTDDEDYALDEVNFFALLAGLKLTRLDKPIHKEEWNLEDICKR